MTNEDKSIIHAQIIGLQQKLTGNLMEDLETKDKIHKLNMQLNNITPSCSLGEECENCGS